MPASALASAPEVRSCVRRDGEELRLDLPPEELAKALRDPASLTWVDIIANGRAPGGRDDGESVLRDIFGFHPLTIDDCYNTTIDPPKVDDYGDYLFMIVHDVTYDDGAGRLHTGELNLYLGKNYVVSVHRAPVHAVGDVRERAEKHALVLQHGAGFLAHALIDVVVDDFHPVVERIDEQILAIEELVLERPQRDTLEQVLRIKRNAQRLKRTILPQRDVMNRLSRNEYPHLIPADAVMYFRDVYDHTVRVDETIETVRDLADSALNTYLSAVNNRINEVMKTLAIVTVIFLPLTLIAGIYGTNFHNVPEYDIRFGYPGMLIVMLVVAIALAGWFKLRGWF
jgi:magnesium transporter